MKAHRSPRTSDSAASGEAAPQLRGDLRDGGLSNSEMATLLRERTDTAAMYDLATQGAASTIPYRDALATSFGDDIDDVGFHGGTPQARWATSLLGVQAFAHDGQVVTASPNPSLEIVSHEVAHIVQQSPNAGAPTGVAAAEGAPEGEARAASRQVAAGQPVQVLQTASGTAIHGFPGPPDVPWEIPLPGPCLPQIFEDLVEEVVETAVGTARQTVEDVREAAVDTVRGWGQALSREVDNAVDRVGDALDLRENEDILDLEEEVDAGAVDVDGDALTQLMHVIRLRRAGEPVPEGERTAARDVVSSLSNDDLRALLRALDDAGLLMEVTQVALGGTPGDTEDDVFEVPVAAWRFWNASDDIDADVQRANTIYEPHDIHIEAISKRTISKAETERVVGHSVPSDFGLDRSNGGGDTFTHADMVAVVNGYGVGQIISGLWVPTVVNDSGTDLSGTSMHTENYTHGANIAFVATDASGADTFAHELGHILTREGHYTGDDDNLMTSGRSRNKNNVDDDRLTDEQVTDIRGDVLGYLRS